jgi:hypothetical protein
LLFNFFLGTKTNLFLLLWNWIHIAFYYLEYILHLNSTFSTINESYILHFSQNLF